MSCVKKPAAKARERPVKKDNEKKNGHRQKHNASSKGPDKTNPIEGALTFVAKKFVKAGGTKFLLKYLPYVMFGYFGNKVAYSYRITDAPDFFNRMMGALSNIGQAFDTILPSFTILDLLFGVIVGVGMRGVVYVKSKNAKKFRKGVEYGSARWGDAKDIDPYMDHDDPDNNIILTKTEGLIMNGKPKSPKYDRNKNVLVIGGSGSGKTRFFVKPQLMQMHSSYVVTDSKGQVLEECGRMLEKHGYKIKVLNTVDFSKSMKYNPFAYIKKETDIMKVTDSLIEGTTLNKQSNQDPFWLDAERLLYNALIGYTMNLSENERNFSSLLQMVNAMEIREDNDKFKNAIDFMFEDLQKRDPDNYAVLQWIKFKQSAGKTARSIMITVGARLARFDIKEVRDVMESDELELDRLGEDKTALFIITSDTTRTFNFMATILYTQLFNILCEKADNEYHGRLPRHVHCIMDEFANLGKIPDWEILISTIRSREISASIILQSLAQLKAIYDKQADIITDNCDTTLFLGGKGRETLKEISELLGKETIDLYNTSDTRGNNPTYGMNYQKIGRELFTPDELARLPGDKCILQIKGVKPFYSNKYDITKHKRYKEIADSNPKLKYDVARELSAKATLSTEDECEMLDMGNLDEKQPEDVVLE